MEKKNHLHKNEEKYLVKMNKRLKNNNNTKLWNWHLTGNAGFVQFTTSLDVGRANAGEMVICYTIGSIQVAKLKRSKWSFRSAVPSLFSSVRSQHQLITIGAVL